MRFFVKTLGCKMNQLDSARVRAALVQAGYEAVETEQEADYVLVNSCTVTAQSDRKSRQAANHVRRDGRALAVLGCGVRADHAGWQQRFPEAQLFRSEAELLDTLGILDQEVPFPITSRTRLPVAIQTGCDDVCAFCITRFARGAHRNIDAGRIVAHVNEAYANGVREIVLTGINLAAWGCSNTRRPADARLHELLATLLADTRMPRIRLSSLGPQYLHDGFFEILADPRICDHLHLSVQSGSPTVLERMQRGHDDRAVYRVAERAAAVRPAVAMAADFIAGFPGETAAEAATTEHMVRDIGFAKLHVFPYSPRAGTTAAAMRDDVAAADKKARAAELRRLGRELREAFIQAHFGTRASVLVENDGTGIASNYIRLHVENAKEGEIHDVEINQHTLADRF